MKKMEVRIIYTYLVTWVDVDDDSEFKRTIVPTTFKINSTAAFIKFEQEFAITQGNVKAHVIAFSFINEEPLMYVDGKPLTEDGNTDVT